MQPTLVSVNTCSSVSTSVHNVCEIILRDSSSFSSFSHYSLSPFVSSFAILMTFCCHSLVLVFHFISLRLSSHSVTYSTLRKSFTCFPEHQLKPYILQVRFHTLIPWSCLLTLVHLFWHSERAEIYVKAYRRKPNRIS